MVSSHSLNAPAIGTFSSWSNMLCSIHHAANGYRQWAKPDVMRTAYRQYQWLFVSGSDKCWCEPNWLKTRPTRLSTPLACETGSLRIQAIDIFVCSGAV